VPLYPSLACHPEKDFEPVGLLAGTPILILARKDFPPKDLKEFIAYVKVNEAKLNAAHAGIGSVSEVSCQLLNSVLDIKPTGVPFNGTGPAMNALVGGQADYMCDQSVNAVPQIEAGTIKAYAVATPERKSVAAGCSGHRGSRPSGVPGPGVERDLRAEGNAGTCGRQVERGGWQGAQWRGRPQALARTWQRDPGAGRAHPGGAGGPGESRNRERDADAQARRLINAIKWIGEGRDAGSALSVSDRSAIFSGIKAVREPNRRVGRLSRPLTSRFLKARRKSPKRQP
jgi:hypothetical protein